MPRIDFKLWDRVYILKLICTAQMTYSSFVLCIYMYLLILQSQLSWECGRTDVMKFKWSVILASVLEFSSGALLAFSANMPGKRGKQHIVLWLTLETFLVPISICLLMQLYYRIVNSTKKFSTDPHYMRTNIAQVCLLLCQYIFMSYAIDFLTHDIQKQKLYDPSIRPESVYAPTDPQITTTESRHIRMSQSFLSQPSSSKGIKLNDTNDESKSSSKENNSLLSQWSSRENMLNVILGNEDKIDKDNEENEQLETTEPKEKELKD